jgi:hypothetical protein
MRVGRGSMDGPRAVKTRVLAREGWRRRQCLVEVEVVCRRSEERDIVTLPLCLCRQAEPRRHFCCTAAVLTIEGM